MKKRSCWRVGLLALAVGFSAADGFCAAKAAAGDSDIEVIKKLERLAGLGRKIVAENQDLINDPAKEDKGFTAAIFSEKLTKYLLDEKIDYAAEVKKGGKSGKLMKQMMTAMGEVITEAQPLINTPGMGFKGFLPALFARKSFEAFNQKGSNIRGKLTAKIYRNAKNAPDAWEIKALDQFLGKDYPKGKAISETTKNDSGEKVLRYIKPEYYVGACLKCHGDPKGERDITGGLKEGFKDGDAGAALSFTALVE